MIRVAPNTFWLRLVVAVAVVFGSFVQVEQSAARGSFVPLGQKMREGSFSPMTLTLPDGRILIAGGLGFEDKWVFGASTEVNVFDPDNGEFSRVGRLQEGRVKTKPVMLPDGKVLFVGGDPGLETSWTSEVLNLETGESKLFESGSDMVGQVAIADLPDDEVLLASQRFLGSSFNFRSVSILNKQTGVVRPVDDVPSLDDASEPLPLPDGRILFFGRQNGRMGVVNRAVFINPATESFTTVKGWLFDRIEPALAVLADGRVLISGGARVAPSGSRKYYQYLRSARIYDPATGTVTPTGNPVFRRQEADAVTLSDGRVLITGGVGPPEARSQVTSRHLRTAEIYDPNTGRFSSTGELSRPRLYASLVALPDGGALAVGGSSRTLESALPTVDRFQPEGHTATVKRLQVTPRILEVRFGQRFELNATLKNTGKGTARNIKVCLSIPNWRKEWFRCPEITRILPGQTQKVTIPGRAKSHRQQLQIRAVGQDVNTYSTIKVKVRPRLAP